MICVSVEIVRWVDDHFPGFVECRLTDRFGRDWPFIEKLPVVTCEALDAGSDYPQPGVIACQVIARGRDAAAREIVEVDTTTPWGVESTGGVSRFHVFADQLVHTP